ncbi:MAG: biotin--[acetyl-CoA-carboxylase] ligase, partial [Chitinophagaceae bacterium]
TSANHTPIKPFIVLSSIESTNNYAMAKLHAGMVDHGACLLALEQYGGKGQRGKRWLSAPGENITMSVIISPSKLGQARLSTFPFILSATIALGCYDFIKDFNIPDVSIKWPNDIYIGDRKAAGILIENSYKGASWEGSIAGIGININQTTFSPDAARPVSLKMVTTITHDVVECGRKLHGRLLQRLIAIANENAIMGEFNTLLYRRGKRTRMRRDNISFEAVIDHVSMSGELVTSDPFEQRFKVGEIEFV